MVVKKKEHFFSLDETETRLPPRLTVQLWDSEFIGPNQYLGESYVPNNELVVLANDTFELSVKVSHNVIIRRTHICMADCGDIP